MFATSYVIDLVPEGVRNLIFDEVTTKSLRVGWDPPRNFTPISYQVRLFPPDKIKSRTLVSGFYCSSSLFEAGLLFFLPVYCQHSITIHYRFYLCSKGSLNWKCEIMMLKFHIFHNHFCKTF